MRNHSFLSDIATLLTAIEFNVHSTHTHTHPRELHSYCQDFFRLWKKCDPTSHVESHKHFIYDVVEHIKYGTRYVYRTGIGIEFESASLTLNTKYAWINYPFIDWVGMEWLCRHFVRRHTFLLSICPHIPATPDDSSCFWFVLLPKWLRIHKRSTRGHCTEHNMCCLVRCT